MHRHVDATCALVLAVVGAGEGHRRRAQPVDGLGVVGDGHVGVADIDRVGRQRHGSAGRTGALEQLVGGARNGRRGGVGDLDGSGAGLGVIAGIGRAVDHVGRAQDISIGLLGIRQRHRLVTDIRRRAGGGRQRERTRALLSISRALHGRQSRVLHRHVDATFALVVAGIGAGEGHRRRAQPVDSLGVVGEGHVGVADIGRGRLERHGSAGRAGALEGRVVGAGEIGRRGVLHHKAGVVGVRLIVAVGHRQGRGVAAQCESSRGRRGDRIVEYHQRIPREIDLIAGIRILRQRSVECDVCTLRAGALEAPVVGQGHRSGRLVGHHLDGAGADRGQTAHRAWEAVGPGPVVDHLQTHDELLARRGPHGRRE